MSQITHSLKEIAILVDFDGGYFNWNRRDKNVEREVANTHAISSAAGLYLKNIFLACSAPFEAVRRCVQDARKDSDLLTLPWGPGRRLLMNKNVIQYKTRQARHYSRLDDAKTTIRDSYTALIYAAEKNLGPLFNEADYPTISSILDSCYITHRFYALADTSDIRLKCDAAIVDEIREEVARNAESTYTNAVLSTWERLIEVMKTATVNLSKGISGATNERFRTEWYDTLSSILPVIAGLNLNSDPRLDEIAGRCQQLLARGADEYSVSLHHRADAFAKAQSIYNDLSSIYGSFGK